MYKDSNKLLVSKVKRSLPYLHWKSSPNLQILCNRVTLFVSQIFTSTHVFNRWPLQLPTQIKLNYIHSFYQTNIFTGKPSQNEETSLQSPLNLSTKDVSPNTPDSPSSLIFDFKKEKLFPVKREPNQSPVDSSISPDPTRVSMSSLPVKDIPSPGSLWTSSSPHSRIWSPLVEDTKRIWSPAVSCEKENNNNTTSTSLDTAKVLVEVRCGGCGDVTSQFRPDTTSRCHSCSSHQHHHSGSRPERIFKVIIRENIYQPAPLW